MNLNKARDHYSDYLEGTLDASLKEPFERALASNSEIKEDYEQFAQAMKLMKHAQSEEIEIPFNLSDKIDARIDHKLWEAKQNSHVGFWNQWKLALIGGMATVAILASLVALNQKGTNNMASIGGVSTETRTADYAYVDGAVTLQVGTGKEIEVEIVNLGTGETLKEIPLKDNKLESPINNRSEDSVALEARVGGESLIVVVPGTQDEAELKGQGTVLDCALTVATVFRTPIIIRNTNTDEPLTWDFEELESSKDIPNYLNDLGLVTSIREDGFVIIAGQ